MARACRGTAQLRITPAEHEVFRRAFADCQLPDGTVNVYMWQAWNLRMFGPHVMAHVNRARETELAVVPPPVLLQVGRVVTVYTDAERADLDTFWGEGGGAWGTDSGDDG